MMIRVLSATFVVVALAVFKPFGLVAWQWQAYVHLAAFWLMGITICMLTDVVLKYVVRMPRSYDRGVGYIIRRNLWFQCINTPLIALGVCLYRHFVLNTRGEGNQLSLANFLETLVIIAFCSFAIGLYWRFKFRSRFLAAELEEARLLNEQLQKRNEAAVAPVDDGEARTMAKETAGHPDILYIESVGNYVKVCRLKDGEVRREMMRATTKQMEVDMNDDPMIVRCHRAFLVNLTQVEQVVIKSGTMKLVIKHSGESIPVSRSNIQRVKDSLYRL